MKDGYWSMMEFPANRPKINKPLEQQTTKELFSRPRDKRTEDFITGRFG
jgi:hypothetical protein